MTKNYEGYVTASLITVLLVKGLLQLNHAAAWHETTYTKVMLAHAAYHRTVCPPELTEFYPLLGSVAVDAVCAMRCETLPSCSFFSVSGRECSLWMFDLDPSYDTADFKAATTPVYWPKRSGPPPATDYALGKLVTNGSNHPLFAKPAMLTYGTSCFPNVTDCYGTNVPPANWVLVDLGSSVPITKIVLTAPFGPMRDFFVNVTIRAGNLGTKSDPMLGRTPTTVTDLQKVQFPVTSNIRYIRIQNEIFDSAVLVCKVQALLGPP